ncbi:MAG: 3'-5' exonuclease [Cytophagales bacterium]|nr:MAG: 3'-5' exonuclease [Cytophagales bacterium]
MGINLKNLLFLDIETVAAYRTYEELPERFKPLWDNKSKNLDPQKLSNPVDLFPDKAAIYAEFGKIIVVGLGFLFQNDKNEWCLKAKSLKNDDEIELLKQFANLIESKFSTAQMVAHNGLEFDFPYLCRRMTINKIPIPYLLQVQGKKPWEINHIDTLELWKFGDRKSYSSLELLASCLDVPTSKDGIDGSKVNYTYYEEQNLKKIADYCTRDVVVLAQIYLRLTGNEIIKTENIFQS